MRAFQFEVADVRGLARCGAHPRERGGDVERSCRIVAGRAYVACDFGPGDGPGGQRRMNDAAVREKLKVMAKLPVARAQPWIGACRSSRQAGQQQRSGCQFRKSAQVPDSSGASRSRPAAAAVPAVWTLAGLDQVAANGLAELHAPLVEGIDVPEHGLDEDLVLVERHQPPQHRRVEPAGRPAATAGGCRDAGGGDPCASLPAISACAWARQLAITRLLAVASAAPLSGSRKSMLTLLVPWCSNWKNECCALEAASPQTTGPVCESDRLAVAPDALAEALHLELLQVRGQARETLAVRQHGVARATEHARGSIRRAARAAPAGCRARWHCGNAGPSHARPRASARSAACRSRARSKAPPPTTANSGRRPSPTSRSAHRRRCRIHPSPRHSSKPPRNASAPPPRRASPRSRRGRGAHSRSSPGS